MIRTHWLSDIFKDIYCLKKELCFWENIKNTRKIRSKSKKNHTYPESCEKAFTENDFVGRRVVLSSDLIQGKKSQKKLKVPQKSMILIPKESRKNS